MAADALAKFSEEAGTPFTVEEFLQALTPSGEIPDSQLEGVAGGYFIAPTFGEAVRDLAIGCSPLATFFKLRSL